MNKKMADAKKTPGKKKAPAKNVGKTASKVRLKPKFLQALELSAGNISRACMSVRINRSTYYDWLEKDPAFAESVDDVKESLIDLVESKLLENIKRGNVAAQIFFLKTRAKSRGYDEKQVESSSEMIQKRLTELSRLIIKRDSEANYYDKD